MSWIAFVKLAIAYGPGLRDAIVELVKFEQSGVHKPDLERKAYEAFRRAAFEARQKQ